MNELSAVALRGPVQVGDSCKRGYSAISVTNWRRLWGGATNLAGKKPGHPCIERRRNVGTPSQGVRPLGVLFSAGGAMFDWPHYERTLWADFSSLKKAAKVEFSGAFHRLRLGFANANVDNLPADLLQKLMRHPAAATTRRYINAAERMKRAGTADTIHFPEVLQVAAVS